MYSRLTNNLKNTIAEYPRGFWMLMGINFINFLGNNLIFPFFALFISKKFGASMTEVGFLFTLFTISGFIGSTIGGALTDRLGRKSMLMYNLITSALFNLAIGFAPSLPFVYGIALVGGIIASAGGPAGQAMIADLVPEEKRAGAFGIFRVVFNTAVAIGVAIGGLVATLLTGIYSLRTICRLVPLDRLPRPVRQVCVLLRLAPSDHAPRARS